MTTPNQLIRVILMLAIVILWCAATAQLAFSKPNWDHFTALVEYASILLVAYYVLARRIYQDKAKRVGPRPQIDVDEALNSAWRIYHSVSSNELILFAQLLLNPGQIIGRIGQRVELTSRSYVIDSSYLLNIPEEFIGKTVAIPVTLRPRMGLLDSFEITDISGSRLSPLLQENTAAHIIAAIRTLVANANVLGEYTMTAANGATMEREFAEFVCRREGNVVDLRKKLIGIYGFPTNLAELIYAMLTIVKTHMPVIVLAAVVSDGSHAGHLGGGVPVRISLKQRSLPTLSISRSLGDRVRDGIRLPLGVRPTIISCDLGEASRCSSYHLEVFGPEGTYLSRQNVIDMDKPKDDRAARDISHSFLGRFGQRYGHLYVKGRDPFDKKKLYFIAHFYERLPGSIVPAALTAIGSAVLIVAAAVIKITGVTGGNSDIVAVLLALPAVAGGWLGFESSGGLFGGTLNAKISRFATMALSLVAALLFVATADLTSESLTYGIRERPLFAVWLFICSLSILNMVLTTVSWVTRAHVQSHFIGRSDADRAS